MLESDADRLEYIRALGAGATLKAGSRIIEIIFENDYLLAGEVEERSPAALMRTCDVGDMQKDTVAEASNPLEGVSKNYRVRRLEPDGTGMTLVVLKAV